MRGRFPLSPMFGRSSKQHGEGKDDDNGDDDEDVNDDDYNYFGSERIVLLQ